MVNVGLEAYDAAGNVLFSYTDRTPRFLGKFDIPGNNTKENRYGSHTNAALASGQPFYVINAFYEGTSYNISLPKITISGNTINWAQEFFFMYAWEYPPVSIEYGVY